MSINVTRVGRTEPTPINTVQTRPTYGLGFETAPSAGGGGGEIDLTSVIAGNVIATSDAISAGNNSIKTYDDGANWYCCISTSDFIQYASSNVVGAPTSITVNDTSPVVSTWETVPQSIELKPDGTRIYVIGSGSDNINEFTLGTPWDLTTMQTPPNHTVYVGGSMSFPGEILIPPSGDVVYFAGNSGVIYQIPLATPWVLSTAGSITAAVDISASIAASITGLTFNSDGTYLYLTNGFNTEADICSFSLGTPYDISTLNTTPSQNVYIGAIDAQPSGLQVSADQTKLWLLCGVPNPHTLKTVSVSMV